MLCRTGAWPRSERSSHRNPYHLAGQGLLGEARRKLRYLALLIVIIGLPGVAISQQASEEPVNTPEYRLIGEEGTKVRSLAFLDARHVLVVREWPATHRWKVEKQRLDVGVVDNPFRRQAPHRDRTLSQVFEYRAEPLRAVAVRSRPFYLALTTGPGHVQWWDSVDRLVYQRITPGLVCQGISPQGALLLVGEGRLELWSTDPHRSKPLWWLKQQITLARFNPTGEDILIAHTDGRLSLWRFSERKFVWRVQAHDAPIRDMRYTPDGRTWITCAEDGWIRLWNEKDGSLIAQLAMRSPQHLAISPNGRWLAVSGEDTQIWDLRTRQRLRTLRGRGALSFSPDGRWLANVLQDKDIGFWPVSEIVER